MGGIPENTHIPGEQKPVYSNSAQYRVEEGSQSAALAGVRAATGGGVPADKNQNVDYYQQAKELLENNKLSEKDLAEVMNNIKEVDFYHLICMYGYEFNLIARNNPVFFKKIFYSHKESFKRLRYTNFKMFEYIGTTVEDDQLRDKNGNTIDEEGNIIEDKTLAPDYDPYADFYYLYDWDFQTIDSERDKLLGLSKEDRNDITYDSYHATRKIIDDCLAKGDIEPVFGLLHELNNYDFCDLLMNNEGMGKLFLDLSKKEFVYLFSDRFNVVRYLYEKENVAFELIFKSDEDFYLLNEYVAKPRGYFFVRRAIQQILDVKHKWLKLSRMMQKSIEAQLNKEEREKLGPTWMVRWLGNETMDLRHLSAIIELASYDIQSINEKSDVKASCQLFRVAHPILEKAYARIGMYEKNYQNGREEMAVINYFVKTVCLSVLSGGIGGLATAGTAGSYILSTVASTALQGVADLAEDPMNVGNMFQAGGIGFGGTVLENGLISKGVPGPAGKILALTIGVAGNAGIDYARGNLSFASTEEQHDKQLDIALYAYYMAQIGGIDYDSFYNEYYIAKKYPGEKGERQEEIVDKLNELTEGVEYVEKDVDVEEDVEEEEEEEE